MQKYAIVILITIFSGCSVTKSTVGNLNYKNTAALTSLNQIKEYNITNSDFNIIKAEIEIKSDGENEKLIGNLKFRRPDKYLISIRNIAGIEAVRVFINKDTILLNDRLNKRVYHGSADYLLNKYGISTSFLPILLGDYISKTDENQQINCEKGGMEIKEITRSNNIYYTIDCDRKKISSVQSVDPVTGDKILIRFEKFINQDTIIYARQIKITGTEELTSINISIEKFEADKGSEIVFIPGKGYVDILLK